MKVLHLTTHLNVGGITAYLLKLIEPLRKHEIQMEVASSGGECEPLFQENNVKLLKLGILTKNELDPKIYFAIPRLIRFIREGKIELMHAHTRVTQVMAHWTSLATGIPFVSTCHGFYKRRLGRRILPAWGKQVIAISPPVAEDLIRTFRVRPEQIRLILNAVDVDALARACEAYDPARVKGEYGFAPSDPVVGVIARLVADKGHPYLIRAFQILKNEFPAARLLIVGEGRQRGFLENLIKENSLQNQVLFTGNIVDIAKPLSAMDVFVLPATWREGFGLSLIEAMACRKPVIATNIWSLNTMIENGVNGIMVEPKQVEPLADSMADLLRNPAKRRQIGQTAKQMVEQKFSIDRMAEELTQFYRACLGKSGKKPGKNLTRRGTPL